MRINGRIEFAGLGLHSGRECRLVIEPYDSPEVVMRSGDNELPLSGFTLTGTNRGSDYAFADGSCVRTCEHVFSALAGLGIWSGARITVDGGEMPALDGCAKLLCEEIAQHAEDDITTSSALSVKQPVIVHSEDRKRFVAAFPCSCLHITYFVEYKFIGAQIYDYVHSPANYRENISGARTFAMASDIEYLRSHGMALGGSLDNAILVGEEIRALGGLRWPDEFVRHKVLDIIGDFASLGRPLNAHIIAVRAGHELHLKLAEKLREENSI